MQPNPTVRTYSPARRSDSDAFYQKRRRSRDLSPVCPGPRSGNGMPRTGSLLDRDDYLPGVRPPYHREHFEDYCTAPGHRIHTELELGQKYMEPHTEIARLEAGRPR